MDARSNESTWEQKDKMTRLVTNNPYKHGDAKCMQTQLLFSKFTCLLIENETLFNQLK